MRYLNLRDADTCMVMTNAHHLWNYRRYLDYFAFIRLMIAVTNYRDNPAGGAFRPKHQTLDDIHTHSHLTLLLEYLLIPWKMYEEPHYISWIFHGMPHAFWLNTRYTARQLIETGGECHVHLSTVSSRENSTKYDHNCINWMVFISWQTLLIIDHWCNSACLGKSYFEWTYVAGYRFQYNVVISRWQLQLNNARLSILFEIKYAKQVW